MCLHLGTHPLLGPVSFVRLGGTSHLTVSVPAAAWSRTQCWEESSSQHISLKGREPERNRDFAPCASATPVFSSSVCCFSSQGLLSTLVSPTCPFAPHPTCPSRSDKAGLLWEAQKASVPSLCAHPHHRVHHVICVSLTLTTLLLEDCNGSIFVST